jgi:hypothetical protein
MSGKMTERNRAIVLNVGMLVGFMWCYLKGYPLKIILGSGVFLIAFANLLMYFRRKRLSR